MYGRSLDADGHGEIESRLDEWNNYPLLETFFPVADISGSSINALFYGGILFQLGVSFN